MIMESKPIGQAGFRPFGFVGSKAGHKDNFKWPSATQTTWIQLSPLRSGLH